MKKGIPFFAAVLALVLCLCLTILPQKSAIADFGDYSGGSDYGGSDWSSSDSSWDSSDSWSSSDSGYYYIGDGGSSGGGFSVIGTIIFLVVVGIIIYSFIKNRSSSSSGKSVAPGATRFDQSQLTPVSEYSKLDAGFDQVALQEKLSNLYVQMQNSWTAKDISPVRPYFTDALYAQMERQCARFAQNNTTNHVDNIAVLGVNLRGYYQSSGMDHMIAEVSTRIVDYTVNDNTGEVISGSKTVEKFMVYEWDLVRKSGTVTGKTDKATVLSCPHCGAPVNINATARCPYCDSIITVNATDWAISAIKGISQRSSGK